MRHLVTSIMVWHTDNHTALSEMGSIPWSTTVPVSCRGKTTASSCSGWGQAGEQSSCWGGDWGCGLDLPGGSLRDSPQSQDIKANVANSHRLVQVKLYNRNLLGRAFMAKKTSAVTTVEAKKRGVRGVLASRLRLGAWALSRQPLRRTREPVLVLGSQLCPLPAHSHRGLYNWQSMVTKFWPVIKLEWSGKSLLL